jgi:GNAT superfamily N-acetyltransferase
MSEVQVRPFRRSDREQLTALVNAHIQAVVPGVSVSVNTVMSQLERDPGEVIVDPWVAERATLVAEQRRRVVAAAHLLRYGEGEDVGAAYRGTAEVNWLRYWPEATHWPDSAEAARPLMDACLGRLRSWGVEHWHADGALPAPGVYGVPQQWPHVRRCTRLAHLGGWADVGSLHVVEAYRRRGVATWLVGQAADWLRRRTMAAAFPRGRLA